MNAEDVLQSFKRGFEDGWRGERNDLFFGWSDGKSYNIITLNVKVIEVAAWRQHRISREATASNWIEQNRKFIIMVNVYYQLRSWRSRDEIDWDLNRDEEDELGGRMFSRRCRWREQSNHPHSPQILWVRRFPSRLCWSRTSYYYSSPSHPRTYAPQSSSSSASYPLISTSETSFSSRSNKSKRWTAPEPLPPPPMAMGSRPQSPERTRGGGRGGRRRMRVKDTRPCLPLSEAEICMEWIRVCGIQGRGML